MEVIKLVKKASNQYEVFTESQVFVLEEDVILEYRLFEGQKLDEEMLKKILQKNQFDKLVRQAYLYSYRYVKSSNEVLDYLLHKDITYSCAQQIVEVLISKKLCDDSLLAKNIASSLARNSNGPRMIQMKLENRKFSKKDIACAMSSITDEDFQEGSSKLLKKAIKKYENLPEKERKQKIKVAFYRHGYYEVAED